MYERDPKLYVKSEIPTEKHDYVGWFWDLGTKKFYRWNDLPGREYGIIKNGDS